MGSGAFCCALTKEIHMLSFICTTASGTKYEVGFTETQNIVVRWTNTSIPVEEENIKGYRTKVWEDCSIHGLMADVENNRWRASVKTLALGLRIEGTDRYNHKPVSWATTKLVSIVREDGKVLL
jgi:hypothetical protein